MSITGMLHFIRNNPISLLCRINKTTREFHRAGFVATALFALKLRPGTKSAG